MNRHLHPSTGWMLAGPARDADLILEQARLLPSGMHELILREMGTPTTLTIRTTAPDHWISHVINIRGAEDPFAGLRIGDTVRRGKGKLRWRVTGLSYLGTQPCVELLSMPEPSATGTSGLALSPQTFAAMGDTIATLTLTGGGQR